MTSCELAERWISLWVDGELSSRCEGDLMVHVEGCVRCREALSETQGRSDLLSRSLRVAPEELSRLRTSTLAAARAVDLSRTPGTIPPIIFLPAAAAAAVILAAAAIFIFGPLGGESRPVLDEGAVYVRHDATQDAGYSIGEEIPWLVRTNRATTRLVDHPASGSETSGDIILDLEHENTSMIHFVGYH